MCPSTTPMWTRTWAQHTCISGVLEWHERTVRQEDTHQIIIMPFLLISHYDFIAVFAILRHITGRNCWRKSTTYYCYPTTKTLLIFRCASPPSVAPNKSHPRRMSFANMFSYDSNNPAESRIVSDARNILEFYSTCRWIGLIKSN